MVIEPGEVKAEPEAYERIGEERPFDVEITPPPLSKREIVRPKYTVKGWIAPKRPCSRPRRRARCRGAAASAGLLA